MNFSNFHFLRPAWILLLLPVLGIAAVGVWSLLRFARAKDEVA